MKEQMLHATKKKSCSNLLIDRRERKEDVKSIKICIKHVLNGGCFNKFKINNLLNA